MNHHNPAPPPPIIRHTTTTQILKQTTSLFYSHLLTFLFLSSLLLTFRSNVDSASHYLSSLIDRDPSLKSLLSRIDSPTPPVSTTPTTTTVTAAAAPFSTSPALAPLTMTSSPEVLILTAPSFTPPPENASPMPLLSFSQTSTLITASPIPWLITEFLSPVLLSPELLEIKFVESSLDDGNAVVDLDFLIKGFEMGRRDATSLFFLAGVLSAAYAYVVFAFIVTYTWANGVIFLKVVDSLLGNYRSFVRTVWDGSNIGLRRLSGFILMKWAVRDALAQLMGIYFFGEIEDQYVFFKVFLRMKFMPFANLAPWVTGHEWESAGFIVIWFLSDLMVGLIFAVDSWVAIVDSRRGGREIVKEGCHMLRMFGDVFTMVFQSLMEVYFMVAWLIFYFAARQKDDTSLGRTFGRRELEGLLDIAR
ncbi:hypothetical protein Pfo_028769 [Paulownia fortunei]|nr:hypothetical protein Pfo_028769 [Paulownia fortunei]